MPNPTVTSRDPFQRATADAEAKYGRWFPLLPTLAASLASSLMVVVAAGLPGPGQDLTPVLKILLVVNSVTTLLAFLFERHVLRKKSRLHDQRWRMLRAEAARLRDTHDISWPVLVAQRQE